MSILSYGWPTTWRFPPELDTLEMQSPNIITSRITHATPEQKQMWRNKGKIVLHQLVELATLLLTPGALLTELVKLTNGQPVDGISIDEFRLGKHNEVQRTTIKNEIMAYREKYPSMLLHGWIGYCLHDFIDQSTVSMVYDLCDWVSPELYIKEGDSITMHVFLRRYRAQMNLSRTLVGLAVHKDYRITETGWLPHLSTQIQRVKALGCAGIAMWAPMHLRNSGERRAVDALLTKGEL